MVWFPQWATHPIPGVSLSAGGLLALADLSTVAQRTVITGGSTWLDALLLAPGLHYQQAAEELAKRSGSNDVLDAVEEVQDDGESVTFRISNAATAHYIQRVARPGETVTLDVGCVPTVKTRFRLRRSLSGLHATVWAVDEVPDLGWLSHLLYLISPMLTVAAVVLAILLQDWWTLGFLLALMLSRLLNIYVIKKRTKHNELKQTPPVEDSPDGDPSDGTLTPGHHHLRASLTEYMVSFSGRDGRSMSSVKLRGTPDDLRAITAGVWLRSKTHVEGYLEAAAKLIVFLVAALSGNMTQAGAIVMMVLLLASAGLLALSNANAKSFKINGRVAAPQEPENLRKKNALKAHLVGGRLAPPADSGGTAVTDLAEKGHAGFSVSET